MRGPASDSLRSPGAGGSSGDGSRLGERERLGRGACSSRFAEGLAYREKVIRFWAFFSIFRTNLGLFLINLGLFIRTAWLQIVNGTATCTNSKDRRQLYHKY